LLLLSGQLIHPSRALLFLTDLGFNFLLSLYILLHERVQTLISLSDELSKLGLPLLPLQKSAVCFLLAGNVGVSFADVILDFLV